MAWIYSALQNEALSAAGLAPSEHLVDAAYVSAEQLVVATARHGIDLIGSTRSNRSWQRRNAEAIQVTDFAVDWERRSVRCAEGHESTSWGEYRDIASGRPFIRAGFSPGDCWPCPAKPRCSRAASRRLTLHPSAEHEALAAARKQREQAGPAPVRATVGHRGHDLAGRAQLRPAPRPLPRTGEDDLPGVATAAALNLDRLATWFRHRSLASEHTSRFSALAA